MLPAWLAALTLVCIALGAVAANVLNVYSGAMAFLSPGVNVPLHRARAVVAVAFGLIGFVIALLALGDAAAGSRHSCWSSCTGSGRGWVWC